MDCIQSTASGEKKFDKIIFFGTGNAQSLNFYNTCFAMKCSGIDKYLLVDAGGGNGILNRLREAGISLSDIDSAIITHAHTDHIIGMVWIYRMVAAGMLKNADIPDFTFYGHDKSLKTLEMMVTMMLPRKFSALLGDRIIFKEVHDGETVNILGNDITFFDILSTKEKQYGFYIEGIAGGRRFVCLGDEPCVSQNKKLIINAGLVLHEAFCLYDEREKFKPYEKHHSTAREAALLSGECGVGKLLLYHTEDSHPADRKKLYSSEAAEYFDGEVFVPDDLDTISLN